MTTSAGKGLKRADYFKDFKLAKIEKKDGAAKGESKGKNILDLMKMPAVPNTLIVVPRTGGLVSVVAQGKLFSALRATLEAAVPALKPNDDGTMSETAKELALRFGYGSSSNG